MSEGDRTEPATPKRRLDAASRGDMLRSRDLAAAVALLVCYGWMVFTGAGASDALSMMLRGALSQVGEGRDRFVPAASAAHMLAQVAVPLVPLALALMIVALAPLVILGGGWTQKVIMPDWSRLDPAKGLKRIVGADALTGLATAVMKVGSGVAVVTVIGLGTLPQIAGLAQGPPETAGVRMVGLLRTLFQALVVFAVLAGLLDLVIQWRRREKRLLMSRQEVRDEMKSAEGTPERKRALRERQYAIAARSARKAMAEATVVLTNPSQFAVALRYRPDVDGVPIILARGTDESARAIRDMADAHAVPRVESPVLARALYFTGDVGRPIAADLYLAVATVLAFLFDLDAKLSRDARLADANVPPPLRFGPDGKPLK